LTRYVKKSDRLNKVDLCGVSLSEMVHIEPILGVGVFVSWLLNWEFHVKLQRLDLSHVLK